MKIHGELPNQTSKSERQHFNHFPSKVSANKTPNLKMRKHFGAISTFKNELMNIHAKYKKRKKEMHTKHAPIFVCMLRLVGAATRSTPTHG